MADPEPTPPLRRDDVDAAIIDLDGTLVDTLDDFHAAVGAMLAELELPPIGRDAVARGVGWGSEHLVRSSLAAAGGDAPARYDAAWAAYQRHYGEVNGRHARLYPGAQAALERMAALGLRLACVTNKPQVFSAALLRTLAIDSFFAVLIGGDSVPRKKPDPLPLLTACERLGSAPARTLMIGDSPVDAEAARRAGCPLVLVRYGFNHGHDLLALGARRLVDRLDEWLA